MFLNPALYSRAQAYDPMDGLGDEVGENLNYKRFVYDFTVSGGAVGAIQLQDEQGLPAVLPVGSLIMSVMLDTVVSLASGGAATLALGVMAANDLKAATGFATFSAPSIVAGVPVMTAATAVKVTSGTQTLVRRNFSVIAQPVSVTIAAAALTAGKIYVHTVIARSALS